MQKSISSCAMPCRAPL